MNKWDDRFMDVAKLTATWSKDPRTKVGSVIVDEKKRIIGVGFNGFPRGVDDHDDRYADRDTKLKFVAHAERNALDNCPIDTEGATLYATLFPCCDCAKGIIQKGIKRVVTFKPEQLERFHVSESLTMFNEAGVTVHYI